MTKHDRKIIAADQVPPIDVAQVAQVAGIDPRWDVAKIATKGHVNTARIEAIYASRSTTKIWLWFLSMIGLAFLTSYVSLRGVLPLTPLAHVRQAFTYDEDTYFDIGGGLKGGASLAWLSSYSPTPESLKMADYLELLKAVGDDYKRFGTNASEWQDVALLKIKPMITRPQKVLTEHSAQLQNGVVVLPEGEDKVYIAAYVEAKWQITEFAYRSCNVLLGTKIDGCDSVSMSDSTVGYEAAQFFNAIKPVKG